MHDIFCRMFVILGLGMHSRGGVRDVGVSAGGILVGIGIPTIDRLFFSRMDTLHRD